MSDLFGTLRELVHTGLERELDRKRLLHLIALQNEADPDLYREEWIPYLEGVTRDLKVPLREVRAQDLDHWSDLLPFAKFSLYFAGNPVGLEAILKSPSFTRVTHLELHRVGTTRKAGLAIARLIASSPRMAHVEELVLDRNNLRAEGLEALLDSEHLGALRSLAVNFDPTGPEGGEAIAKAGTLPSLERLVLHENKLKDDGVRALATGDLPALRELTLWQNGVRTAGIEALAEGDVGGDLTALCLYGNPIRDKGVQHIAHSGAFTAIERLEVLNANAKRKGLAALTATASLPNLRTLRAMFDAEADDAVAYVRSPAAASLRSLDLDVGQPVPDGAHAIASSPHMSSLTNLQIHKWKIEPDGAKALAESEHVTALRRLDLHGNQPGADGVAALVNSPHAEHLEELGLGFTYVGDGAARAIASSPHLSNLRVLRMSYCGLTHHGARALAESKNLTGLRKLDVCSNKLGDEGALTLANGPAMTNLASLLIGSNGISDDARERVRTCPNLRLAHAFST